MDTLTTQRDDRDLRTPGTNTSVDEWSLRATLAIVACGIGNILGATTIVNATFSNFLVPVSTDLGWQRSQFSFVLTLLSLVGVFAYPVSGRLIDRYGARPIALVGNVAFGMAVASLSQMPADRTIVYGLFCVIGCVATFPSTVLLARVVSTWFVARRGLVLGLSGGVAFGIGGALIPSAAQWLIDTYGWRGAYLGLGALVIGVGFPVFFLFLHESPTLAVDPRTRRFMPGMSLAEASRQKAFWILLGAVSLGAGSISAIITHIVPLVGESGGSISVALGALAGLYLVNALWQIGLGLMLDRLASPRIAALFILPGIGGVVLLSLAGAPAILVTGGFLIGLSCGTEYGLLPFCIPRYFGFRAYGEIYGWIFGAIMLVQGVAPFLMDITFEATGNYRLAMIGIGITLAGCAGAVGLLPRYGGTRQGGPNAKVLSSAADRADL